MKKKKLRVLALFDVGSPTALDEDLKAELKTADWKVEKDVLDALIAGVNIVELDPC